MLKEMAGGSELKPSLRGLIKKYYTFAEYYRRKTRRTIDRISGCLEPRYQLSLEVVYSLYLLIFERIDVLNGKFTPAELTPSLAEVKERLCMTVSSFESGERAYSARR